MAAFAALEKPVESRTVVVVLNSLKISVIDNFFVDWVPMPMVNTDSVRKNCFLHNIYYLVIVEDMAVVGFEPLGL